jgi:hypothetical protein
MRGEIITEILKTLNARFPESTNVFEDLTYLMQENWPADFAKFRDYGDKKIKAMAAVFYESGADCEEEWYQFKQNIRYHSLRQLTERTTAKKFWSEALSEQNSRLWENGGQAFKCFRNFIEKILAVPISSADAERGFSVQNNIKTDRRASLNLESLDALMRIRLNGVFKSFNFKTAARRWVRENHYAVGSRKVRGPNKKKGASETPDAAAQGSYLEDTYK